MQPSKLTSFALAAALTGTAPLFIHTVQAQETIPLTEQPADRPEVDSERVVQLAICLDTSGSMDGLINAARQKLWSIVNELALAEPEPRLEVALLTYGNDGHNPENGWVKVETPFTQDLDTVSEMLFALTTNGGSEYVGRVVHSATEELAWHPSTDALKIIVVAGNESADQDPQVSFRDACRGAITNGVMVNSIYCVYSGDGSAVRDTWEEVARLADGQFGTIDQNDAAVVVATPHDRELIELSSAINETYIPFGAEGRAGWANQMQQDANALGLNNAAAAERAQFKGKSLYYCSWDLVDACNNGDVDLAELSEEELPEELKGKSPAEIEEYVNAMTAKRAAIQKQIDEISKQRQRFVLAEQNRRSSREVDDFDILIRSAIREQARSRGFEFEDAEQGDPASTAEDDVLPYFTKVGDIWVSANYVDTFERLRAEEISGGEITARITEGDEAYGKLLEQLDEPTRHALEAITHGRVFVKVGSDVYQVILKPEAEGEMPVAGRNATQSVRTLNAPQQDIRSQQAIRLQQGQVEQQIETEPAFVQRGTLWIDASYVDTYDARIADGKEPEVEETIDNTPEGRKALLKRLTDVQRQAAERVIDRMLENWGGGLMVLIDGKLVHLPFEC